MIEQYTMGSTNLNIKKIPSTYHSNSLVVYFHGAVVRANKSPPIFYLHNLPFDVISISDSNLELDSKLTTGWHSNGSELKVNDAINSYIKSMKSRYENIVCVGSSAGGFVALRTAMQTGVMAAAYNCQIDIRKYGDYSNTSWKRFSEIFNGTALESLDELIIGDKITEAKTFQPMLISQNKSDEYHYQHQFTPFKNLVNRLGHKQIKFFEFNEDGPNPHKIRCTGNEIMAVRILKDVQGLISEKQNMEITPNPLVH